MEGELVARAILELAAAWLLCGVVLTAFSIMRSDARNQARAAKEQR